MRSQIALLCGALLASACTTTTDFAPPSIDLANARTVHGSAAQNGTCSERVAGASITHTVVGARALIDNFIYEYRCRAHQAANGRQVFEVPSLLAVVGAATAAAFGAGSDVAIAGGAASALLNGGRDYYAPQQKAEIYDGALDALLCIKTEAVDMGSFDFSEPSTAAVVVQNLRNSEGGPTVTVDEQYFDLVVASLFSVERVLAQRLSAIGSFDPAGVVAEIEQLNEQIRNRQNSDEGRGGTSSGSEKDLAPPPQSAVARALHEGGMPLAEARRVAIRLDTLQPRLQRCVVRAKI